MHSITLIDNHFTKSEMKFLLTELLDTKINFHKLHRLSVTEGNNKADTTHDDVRIKELEEAKKSLKTILDSDSYSVTSLINIVSNG